MVFQKKPSVLHLAPVLAIDPDFWSRLQNAHGGMDEKAWADLFSDNQRISNTVPVMPLSDGVSLMTLTGVVTKHGPDAWDRMFGVSGFSTLDLEKQCVALKSDPMTHTVIVDVDSPGGSVDGTSAGADALADLAAHKTVIVHTSGMMASAAYWIGSQATEIYVDKTASVGSIGVFCVVPDTSRMYEANGVKMNLVKSAPNKGAGTPGTPVTEEHLKEFQSNVDTIHGLFVSAVARGRNMKRKYERGSNAVITVPDDGKVYIGQQAVDLGLADDVKSFSMLVSEVVSRPRPTGLPQKPTSLVKGVRMKELKVLFGMSEDAPDSELLASVAGMLNSVKTMKESLMADIKEKSDAALAAYKAEQRKSDILKSHATKISGAQMESAKALVDKDPDAFSAFLANMPVMVPTAAAARIDTTGDVPHTEVKNAPIELSDRDDRNRLAKMAKELQAKNPKLSWDEALEAALEAK